MRRERTQTRRGERANSESKWYDFIPVPFDFEAVAILLALVALVIASLVIVPYVWLGVLFGVELIVWVVVTCVGYATWLIFGRPWTVAVVDADGYVAAEIDVRGRRRARLAAQTAREHLAAGLSPAAIMRLRAEFDPTQ